MSKNTNVSNAVSVLKRGGRETESSREREGEKERERELSKKVPNFAHRTGTFSAMRKVGTFGGLCVLYE